MRGVRRLLVLLLVASLLGCAAPVRFTSTPTDHSPVTSEATQILTIELTDTAEPQSATPTPEPGLRTNGPYLAYFRTVDESYQLVMMDADGFGRKVTTLPQEVTDFLEEQPYVLSMDLVSPDGHWLAFYTGFAGPEWFKSEMGKGPFNLALKLLDLQTGEINLVASLLSKDYPNNFVEAAKQLNDPNITADTLRGSFLHGITRAIAWSPDSKYLAFGGQMEGLSSDLYVYHLESRTIRRLSSGSQELQWIDWLPDGKTILHGATYEVMRNTYDIYSASLDRTSVLHLSTSSLQSGVREWVNADIYIEYDSQNGPGSYGLRLVNINTGTVTKVWDGSFLSYSIDRNGNWLVVNALTPDISPYQDELSAETNSTPGLYFVDLSSFAKHKVEFQSEGMSFNYFPFPFDVGNQSFILISENSGSYLLSENGELTSFDLRAAQISTSPDSTLWVAITKDTVNIYTHDNVLVTTLPFSLKYPGTSKLFWTPDSTGLFLIYESDIYFIDPAAGALQSVETHLLDNQSDPASLWVTYQ